MMSSRGDMTGESLAAVAGADDGEPVRLLHSVSPPKQPSAATESEFRNPKSEGVKQALYARNHILNSGMVRAFPETVYGLYPSSVFVSMRSETVHETRKILDRRGFPTPPNLSAGQECPADRGTSADPL
jgi:hypothetical protein